MIKKFIVSFLCVVFIAGVIFSGVCLLYFAIPSQTAMNSISLPSTVEDPEETESSSTEDEEESRRYVSGGCSSVTDSQRGTEQRF